MAVSSYRVLGWIRWPVALIGIGYSMVVLVLLFNPETGVPAAGSNFVPLRTIRLQLAHGFILQLIGNTLLLAPVGFVFRIWDRSLKWIFGALIAIAITIEVAQGMVDRVSDIDDVILNVFGGFIGSLVGSGVAAIVARTTQTPTSEKRLSDDDH